MLKIRTLCLCLTFLQSGCHLTRTAPPLPAAFKHSAEIPGFEHIRSQFTDYDQRMIKEQSFERVKQLAKTYPDILFHRQGYFSLLVVSGGGDFGAFGAGILNGWTQSGKRPEFTTVTGISTGALIAPLAFAGPKYDKALREAYTTISAKDVFTDKPVLWTLLTGGESLKDYKPLQKLLDKYVTATMLDDIAKAYYQGRRLYVGTTNLYSRDLVVWDMTRIATSKNPEKLALFKKILLASASIPAVFPPVYFDVMAQGQIYSEMHVDGGTTFAVFLSRLGSDLKAAKEHFHLKNMPNVKIFVIRNNQNRFPYKVVKPKLLSIGKRALKSVTAAQGSADVIFIYLCSLLQHVDFNLTYIPPDFVADADKMFDQKQMNALYQIGYKKGRTGSFWEKIPPDVAILHR